MEKSQLLILIKVAVNKLTSILPFYDLLLICHDFPKTKDRSVHLIRMRRQWKIFAVESYTIKLWLLNLRNDV